MPIFRVRGLMLGLAIPLLSWVSSAWAVDPALFKTEVATRYADGRLDSRELGPAFQDVVVRLAGTSAVLEEATIKAALAKPLDFAEKGEPLKIEGKRPRLSVTFFPDKLTSLLEQAGFHVWDERPKVMFVWMEGALPATLPASLSAQVAQEARRRGLPVMLAQGVMDAFSKLPEGTELFKASAGMWQGLANRSGAQIVVLARVQAAESGITGEWRVVGPEGAREYSAAFTSAEEFLRYLPCFLAETRSATVHWPQVDEGMLVVKVEGGSSFAGYVGIQSALGKAGFRGLSAIRVESGNIWFRADRLDAAAASQDSRLLAVAEGGSGNALWDRARSAASPLHVYRWRQDVPPAGAN